MYVSTSSKSTSSVDDMRVMYSCSGANSAARHFSKSALARPMMILKKPVSVRMQMWPWTHRWQILKPGIAWSRGHISVRYSEHAWHAYRFGALFFVISLGEGALGRRTSRPVNRKRHSRQTVWYLTELDPIS